jgi:hypothetical protein
MTASRAATRKLQEETEPRFETSTPPKAQWQDQPERNQPKKINPEEISQGEINQEEIGQEKSTRRNPATTRPAHRPSENAASNLRALQHGWG